MWRTIFVVTLAFVSIDPVCAQRSGSSQGKIVRLIRQEIEDENIVGAQVLVGDTRSSSRRPTNLGHIGIDDPRPVSDKTIFCIASCSKPVASALVFTLLDQRKLRLNQSAAELIPEMKSPKSTGGKEVRSPTLRELLAHRGGIYSQKQKITEDQHAAIRDFSLSLDESISVIAKQPLIADPGSEYAYSGAGYCVIGKMAEQATGRDFESLLQGNLCKPLGMTSTTYFPIGERFDQIAGGGQSILTPPHSLGERLKLPLIGGSLYTNATDLEKFARMVIQGGRSENAAVLSSTAFSHFISAAFPDQPYGYGWLQKRDGKRVVALSHKGSLPPYQSAIRIDLERNTYAIVLWTLAKPANVEATIRIKDKVSALLM